MRRYPTFATLSAVAALALSACNVEVNIHLDSDSDAEEAQPSVAPGASTDRGAPASSPLPFPRQQPSQPLVEFPVLSGDRAVQDALWRPEAPRPEALAFRDIASLRAGPRFTPFTEAPSLRNGEEIAASIRSEQSALQSLERDRTARVYFLINRAGRIERTMLASSSGSEAVDDAAMRVARTYRFVPARNRGERVPVWVSFPVTFKAR